MVTFGFSPLHKLFQLLKMRSMILRSMGGGSVKWVADLHLLHFLHHAVDEHIVDGILDEQSTSGDAILTLAGRREVLSKREDWPQNLQTKKCN